MTNLEKHLKEIEDRANAATEGPWYGENGDYNGGYCIEGISKQHKVDVVVNCHAYDDEPGVLKKQDANFIAHARTDIPKLIEVIRVLSRGLKSYTHIPGMCGPADKALTKATEILGGEHE